MPVMASVLTRLGGIKPILGAIAVTGVVALVAALWVQSGRLDRALAENGELRVRLDTVVEANETNMETINALRKANADLLERIRLDEEAAAEAARRAAERAQELRRQRDDARRQLEAALGATPSCEALGRMDLAAACPAFGDRLLDLYQRGRPNGDGDGRGPGSGPHP